MTHFTLQPARHLYIHVPFCSRRCAYCDFSIAVRRDVPVRTYLDALRAEFNVRQLSCDMSVLDTVYLGGGTPSRLGGDGIVEALQIVREYARIATDAEITIEANPEDITDESVAAWRSAGVNRLSIGVQSFSDSVLQWMHRVHDSREAETAIATARRGGISDISIDLIFALPVEVPRNWTTDLDFALSFMPSHISLYGLTIESGTPLARWQARGDVQETPEERYESEFLEAHARLVTAGYLHYEVSNFALPGHRARHNSAYWKHVPYVGVGPSAHGFDGNMRRWNLRAYTDWLGALDERVDPKAGDEALTQDNRIAESVYLGLRTSDGLVLQFDSERAFAARWLAEGWVDVEWSAEGKIGRVRCTPTGWLRLDALAATLAAERSRESANAPIL